MKKLIVFIILLFSSTTFAWTISWEVTGTPDGSMLYYKELAAVDFLSIDVGTALSYDLDSMGFIPGTRYEFYVEAYIGIPRSFSGETDHIRWTYPSPPVVIEMQDRPVNIIINP